MKMFFVITSFIPLLCIAQSKDERIKEIHSLYRDVEIRLANCIKIPVTLYYEDGYVEGGSTEMEGYYDTSAKALIKIVERTYNDWTQDETSYYFDKGDLFFIFRQGNNPGEMYTAEELGVSEQELQESGGEAKTINYYEYRYYFKGKDCIRNLSKFKTLGTEEEVNLEEVKNEPLSVSDSYIPGLNHHGYMLFREFEKQSGIKR